MALYVSFSVTYGSFSPPLLQGLAIDIGSFGGSPSNAHYFISLQADTGPQARKLQGGRGVAEAAGCGVERTGGSVRSDN